MERLPNSSVVPSLVDMSDGPLSPADTTVEENDDAKEASSNTWGGALRTSPAETDGRSGALGMASLTLSAALFRELLILNCKSVGEHVQ